MNGNDRAERLRILAGMIERLPREPALWKDALAVLENLAPEGAVVSALTEGLRTWPEPWMAISLLGETRHPDAWEPLACAVRDPRSGYLGDRAAGALAKVGGDDSHATLVGWLWESHAPPVQNRVLDAIRAYGRPEGAVALRDAWAAGRISLTSAAVRLAAMPTSLELLAGWWGVDGDRALAFEVLVVMASPLRRGPLSPELRTLVEAARSAPPRPLDRFDRARFDEWLAG